MRLPDLKKYKFVFDFLQLRSLYPFYKKILIKSNDEYFYKEAKNEEFELTNSIHIVNYIPPFLKPIIDENHGLKAISIYYYYGFMVNLNGYTDIQDYMKDKLGSKSRTKMRSYVRKLETCFKITYKCYFGEISKEEYSRLIRKIHSFITRRFQQRGDTHQILEQWEFIQTSSYEMILNKMASLFVIYNDQEPIDICLNYHYGNLFHNGIRSYDIDYSKFRIGYIDILKQLEWCFANDIKIFDLGPGDMAYKRMWCNVVYDFEHQILYDKNSISKKVIAVCLSYYLSAKEFMKKKNIHKVYHKIRRLGRKPNTTENKYNEPRFEHLNLDILPEGLKISPIDLNDESYSFLKKPIHDFQYLNLVPIDDIMVIGSDNEKNVYYILGKKKIEQLKLL